MSRIKVRRLSVPGTADVLEKVQHEQTSILNDCTSTKFPASHQLAGRNLALARRRSFAPVDHLTGKLGGRATASSPSPRDLREGSRTAGLFTCERQSLLLAASAGLKLPVSTSCTASREMLQTVQERLLRHSGDKGPDGGLHERPNRPPTNMFSDLSTAGKA